MLLLSHLPYTMFRESIIGIVNNQFGLEFSAEIFIVKFIFTYFHKTCILGIRPKHEYGKLLLNLLKITPPPTTRFS